MWSDEAISMGEGAIVPWHAVERFGDAAAARRYLSALGADTLRSLRRLVGRGADGLDDDAVLDQAAELLARGDYVFVRVGAQRAGGARVHPHDPTTPLADIRVPAPKPRPAPKVGPELAWIEIHVLGSTGSSYAGAQLRVWLPDGTVHRTELDEVSRCRIESIDGTGTCHVELLAGAQPRPSAITFDGGAPPSGTLEPGGRSAGVVTNRAHTLVVEEPGVTCVRLVGALYELNKAFLLPDALEGIRLLAHMYETMPGAELLVVGHTDRTGKKFRNDSLSLERAQALIAYMRDDVDAWLAFYDDSTDFSRRWGATEDLSMLSALPRGSTAYYSDEHGDHSYEAAVRRFQVANGLVVDGVAGPLTRAKLVAEYMALDGTTLPADITAVAHGCGESFPVVPTDDEVEELQNRRVEVFFFRDGIDPAPPSELSSPGSTEYPAWNEAVEQERTFTPSAAGRGRLIVATDFDIEYVAYSGIVFVLRSVDGAYERNLDPVANGLTLDRDVLLEFTDVPRAAFLTLLARWPEGDEQAMFVDVPFSEISRSTDDDEVVDPFTLEPVG